MDEAALTQFTAVTGSSLSVAAQYLRLADYSLEQAVGLFYANDGADLEQTTQQSQAPPIPPPSTRPPEPQGYQDREGIVHLDSDQDDENFSDGDDVQMTGQNSREPTAPGRSISTIHIPSSATPIGHTDRLVDDDEAMARRLQEEIYGAAGAGGGRDEVIDEHGYRAPIARTTETLVGPGSFDPSNADEMRAAVNEQMRARREVRSSRDRHGIFNQVPTSSIWTDPDNDPRRRRDQLAQSTGGASEASQKNNVLAEMYRPPFELISRLSWDQARQQGKDGEKWILVNIQDPSIFDCQLLNRDIWKNAGIMETVKENFIFMQYSKDDPRGNQYVQYYFQNKDSTDAYPHIAIVDPRTGEQVKVWSGPPAPKAMDFLMQLHEFLDRYSLKAAAKNPVARRKPETKKEARVERMSEEQMMEMAMQASLAGTNGQYTDDPDELTRIAGNLRNDKGKQKEGDGVLLDKTESPHTHASSPSRSTTSPFTSILSSHPHTEPAPNATNATRIQFRHANGRVVRRFTLSDPVRIIYEWLKASPLEGKAGMEFELIFMGKNLIELLDDTIEHAGLKNGTIMAEFIES